jgi:regulator of protease activity HflC (stomatin/prohibitin superfamily)
MAQSDNRLACALLTIATLGIVRFFSVPQGYVCLITAFGRYRRTCNPGLGSCLWLWGIYEQLLDAIPTKEQVRTYDNESVFTRDGVNCIIDTVVFYTIKEPFKATFEIDNYQGAVESLVQATLRNECGNLSARELLAGRQRLASQLRGQLDNDTTPWGISVRLVEITDIKMATTQAG